MATWSVALISRITNRLYSCNVCAWKALQSVAIVTGDEVLGRNCCSNSAWKAVRLLRCTNCMSCGVVPSRHIVQFALIRALRTRLLSLRSVVPSRHLTHNLTPCTNVHFIEQKCAIHWTKMFNFFVKPNEQSSSLLEYSAMARKSLLKTNVFFAISE